MSLSPDAIVRRNPAMIFTELDDTVVMMDADEGCYHELDPVGARIWALLETGRSAGDLSEALLREYDVDPESCRRDMLAFLERALEFGIIETGEAGR